MAFVICEECGDSFPSKNALARHARKHEEKPEVRYECDECGKVRLTVHTQYTPNPRTGIIIYVLLAAVFEQRDNG